MSLLEDIPEPERLEVFCPVAEVVLTNLVNNGVEAMRTTRPAQRALTISARREAEGRVVVRVVDQGPQMSGLVLMEVLGRREDSLRMIFVTVHADVPMAAEAMRRGAVDFIEKPKVHLGYR